MQVILEGSLRHFGAGELLAFLCARGGGGTLDLDASGKRARIFFRDAKVVWAESNQSQKSVSETLIDAFGWDAGAFRLLDTIELPANATAVSLDVGEVMAEAARRRESYRDGDVFRVVDDPALQQQVSLTSAEFRLLFRVGSGKSYGELARDAGMSATELAATLRKLLGDGLITMARDTAPAPVQAEPQPQPEPPAEAKKTMPQGEARASRVGSLTPDMNPDISHPLLEAEYTIGRVAENAIPIADGSVSSKHARLYQQDGEFFLEDLGSRNGTYVNGERLSAPRQLADGDLVRFGKVLMTFNLASDIAPLETTTQPEVKV